MKTDRRKLRSRDLMLAVLAFGLSLKFGMAYGQSPAYWREAHFQGQMADAFRFYANRFEDGSAAGLCPDPAERQDAARKAREFAARLDRKRTACLRAAFLPWLWSAPDLPPS